MKRQKLSILLLTVLASISTVALADSKYPAADFQPEVVFQDHNYIAKSSGASAKHDTGSSKTQAAASSVADPKYPAADFKPQVVYQDPSYKNQPSTSVASSAKAQASSSSSEVVAEKVIDKKGKDSGSDLMLALVAAAVAGFFIIKSQGKAKPQPTSSRRVYAAVHPGGGMTGVARYVNKVSGTGVTRYLEKQAKAAVAANVSVEQSTTSASAPAATGVSRYMEKNTASAKSEEALTGVDKYLRGRG